MGMALKNSSVDLSILIVWPDSADNLLWTVTEIEKGLAELKAAWEILVVARENEGNVQSVAGKCGAKCFVENNHEYGSALLRGISESRGKYVLTIDTNLSGPCDVLSSLWNAREQADILIASRYVKGGKTKQGLLRKVLSRTLNAFFSRGLSISASDVSCALRLYKKNIFGRINLEFKSYVALTEVLLNAAALGMQIKEIPFTYATRAPAGISAKDRNFGLDYLKLFYRVWKYRNSIDFPDYDWRAHNSRIPLQRYWQRRRHDIVMNFASSDSRVCDVGCGSSHILADLPDVIGVDLRRDKLSFMRSKSPFLVQADGLDLPFEDARFDCVICSEVIEHVPEENGRLIDELLRIVKPGGSLVLGTPDYGQWQWVWIEWLYGKVAPGAYADEHVTHYTFKTLKEATEQRGCTIENFDYICKGELILKIRKPTRQTKEKRE